MLIETIYSIFCDMLVMLFSGVGSIVSLPVSLITTLSTITGYGVFVVGADFVGLFCASVAFWFTVKVSLGFATWVWKMLPLT